MAHENFEVIEKEKAKLAAALASTRGIEEKTKQLIYTMETDLSMQERKIHALQQQMFIYENSFKQQLKLVLKNSVAHLRTFGCRHPFIGKIMKKTYRMLKSAYDVFFKRNGVDG